MHILEAILFGNHIAIFLQDRILTGPGAAVANLGVGILFVWFIWIGSSGLSRSSTILGSTPGSFQLVMFLPLHQH